MKACLNALEFVSSKVSSRICMFSQRQVKLNYMARNVGRERCVGGWVSCRS